jgi:putative transferase (TIGR04331 family)
MVARTLVTTADERTWPKDKSEPVLFLGEWCKRYSKKHVWERMDYEVADYHWDDRKKLFGDYQYLKELYEDLLIELSKKLNQIHRTNHKVRYWRILVGMWLGYFNHILYDRWFMLKYAFSAYDISRCYLLDRSDDSTVPNDMDQFIEMMVRDDWNESIYAELLKSCWNDELDLIVVKNNSTINIKNKATSNSVYIKKIIIFFVIRILDGYNRIFLNNNDSFFITSYIPRKNNIKLQIKLRQFPKLWNTKSILPMAFQQGVRQWNLRKKERNMQQFDDIIRHFVVKQMPKIYHEGYKFLYNSSQSVRWPKNPKLIFTSNSYVVDELFKCWAAEKTEKGIPLVIGQHGGHFGTNKFSFFEDHQIDIADKWVSWGWNDKKKSNILPLGNFSLKTKKLNYDKDGDVLMVELNMPRYSYALYSCTVSRQWLDYFSDQVIFLQALPIEILKKVTLRMKRTDYGWDMLERLKEKHLEVKIENGYTDIDDSMKKCRILISTYNATVFLNSLSYDIPTIMFWNPNHWELNKEADYYFDQLESVGVFHKTPESAAKHLTKIWNQVDEWWESGPVQRIKNEFCFKYSRTNNKLECNFKNMLMDVSNI